MVRPGIALPEQDEHAQHLSAIRSICERHHLPAAEIEALYERELAHLRQGALITNYLSIFVTRRVDELLRAGRSSLVPAGAAAAPLQ